MAGFLLEYLTNDTGANGAAAFAEGEPQSLIHRNQRYHLHLVDMLSPGITMSVPSGRYTVPVTLVVRK